MNLYHLIVIVATLSYSLANCPIRLDYIKNGIVQGEYLSEWKPVADAMWDNCVNLNDSGAVAVDDHGCLAVYVWCGWQNSTLPWKNDTLTNVFSLSKLASVMVPLKQIDMGDMDFDDFGGEIWSNFSTRGKENITIGMLMSHAGAVPDFCTPEHPYPPFQYSDIAIDGDQSFLEQLLIEKYMDWESSPDNYVCGYHVNNYGWVIRPFVKRADPNGRDIATFMKEEFADPLGIEIHYGIRPNETDLHNRVATLTPGPNIVRNSSAYQQLVVTLGNSTSRQFCGLFTPEEELFYYYFSFNQPALRNALWEGGVLYSTAKDLSRLFSLLSNHGKTAHGTRYFSHGAVTAAADVVFDGIDQMNYEHTIYTRIGAYKNDNDRYNIISNTAIAKTGAGGQLAVLEPKKKANFVYLTSVMESDSDTSAFTPTGVNILNAFYQVLGCRSDEP